MRQAALLTVVIAMTALVVTSTAAADQHRSSCPNGFTAYPVPTQAGDEALGLPRILAGLAAGVYTVPELIATADEIDANDDGVFCLKAVSNLRGASDRVWGFFYGARDNTTAAS